MKKFLNSLIIIFVFMFIGIVNVKAVKLTISSNDKVALNKTIDVTITVSDYNGVPGTIYVEYPNDLLQCNTNCPGSQSINGNTSFTYQFKGIANGKATIKVTSNYNGADANKEITVGTTTTQSQPQKQEQTTTTTTTQAPKSNNANLKSIVVKTSDDIVVNLSPTFSPSVYEYEASVASDVKTVNVEAIMEDSKANLVISNNVNDELIAGENNKITITVTAEDGTKKQYVVNIKREALTADATLSSLTIKEYKDFEFKSDKFNYVIKVKNNVNKLTLDYTLSDENSTAKVDGNKDLKDGSKVKITVTAQDGTKKVYTLEISKETEEKKETNDVVAEKNPLIIMGLSIFAFGLIGGIVYVIKK